MEPPKNPERKSSLLWNKKRALEGERDELGSKVKKARKVLKLQSSFTNDYWFERAELAKMDSARVKLQRKISLTDFLFRHPDPESQENEKEWTETQVAKDLWDQFKAKELEEKLLRKQHSRILKGEREPGSTRRVFMKLFTTSKIGLKVMDTGAGRRDSTDQSVFRERMIELYGCRFPETDPNRIVNSLWCPVTCQYVKSGDARAAHLFAWEHGQDVMDSIFGRSDPTELFEPVNGLILSQGAELRMDKGLFVIVPDVTSNASAQEIQNWHLSDPKEYQIRVVDSKDKRMRETITAQELRTWNDLDGKKLVFRSQFRPKARYLHFLYCVTMLRHAWRKEKATEVLQHEIDKPWWATSGRYLNENMLRAFVEEMGHEYEALMEGAIEEGGGKVAARRLITPRSP